MAKPIYELSKRGAHGFAVASAEDTHDRQQAEPGVETRSRLTNRRAIQNKITNSYVIEIII